MIAALWMFATASAGGFLQVGTGARLLDLPTGALLAGGTFRVGIDAGTVVPFVGGSAALGRISEQDDDDALFGNQWSAAAGVRFDLADEEGPAQPFVAVGATLGQARGGSRYADDYRDQLVVPLGPGAFVGAGADAFLSPRVSIGLELGGAYAQTRATFTETEGGEVLYDEELLRGDVLYTYGDLHLVFRFGRQS